MISDAFPWLILLRDLSGKSALLLLAAWALALGMRRASAAARHLVWLLAFAGLLLLPLLSMTLPPRPVPVLPTPAVSPVLSAVAAPPVFTAAPPAGVLARQPTLPRPVASTPARAQPPVMSAWPQWVCRTWLLGTLLAALPLVAGWLLAVQRIRRCAPVTDPATLAFATEAARQLGVRRPVSLRSGLPVAVPVTFGLLRPVVLLPEGAMSWPAERLRVALLHEFAHVRRGDWAAQTTARLVCALFWHNPLVWLGARRLRAEAERACDDLVLQSGISAPDYAQHLLAVAAALSGTSRPLPLAVPMAGQAALESRLRAVLTACPRRAPSRRLAACAFVLALVVLVPLAALRPAARAARRTAPPSPIVAAVLPAPPRAVRPAPVSPSVPILSPPKGVPPMKPLTPVKIAALAALAAGLALPAAHAKPTTPVKHAPTPKLAYIPTPAQIQILLAQARLRRDINAYKKAYPPVPAALALHWNEIVLQYAPPKTVMALLPWGPGGKNPEGVKEIMFLGDNAILVNATPAGYAQVQEAVKRLDVAPEATSVVPLQVQIKFEWASTANAPNAALDKSVDTLTIMAEEGRKAQASSQHLRNGTGGRETITVLAHLKPGGIVVLDITEHSETTARVGETVSSDSQTTVSIKDGQTGTVGGLVLGSPPSGQSARRMLFVTPTLIHPAAESPLGTRSVPLRAGDIINVNHFTAFPSTGKGPVNLVPDKAP